MVFAPSGLEDELSKNTVYIVFYYLMAIVLIADAIAVRPRICYEIKGYRMQTT